MAGPATDKQAGGSQERKRTFGKFTGGLNNAADLTSLAENELAVVDNFEVDINGGLTSRPPIVRAAVAPVADAQMEMIGYFTDTSGVVHVVVSSAGNGTYLWNISTETYVKITSVVASGAAQYGDKLYICSETEAGGHWDGTLWTSLATGDFKMPKGEQITLYKSRFWMVSREAATNRTRVYFSRITAAGTIPTSINEWNVWLADGNDFFDVSAGDGQWITRLIAGSNELYIFRSGSTYYFKYDVSPLSGRLDLLDAYIGADNRHSVDRYEFSYLVLHGGRLYRFVSYNFYPLNDPQKLQLRASASTTSLAVKSAVSVFGRRALVWYGGTIFALDLSQGTWSTWSSPTTMMGYALREPRQEDDLSPDTAYGVTASTDTTLFALYRIVDGFSGGGGEEITCVAQTKAFDFDTPGDWKRMFYWSADVLTARDVIGIARPLQLSSQVPTYDDLETRTYDEFEAGTYDSMMEKTGTVTTDREYPTVTPYRVSVTFQRDMRFRRCSFEVRLTNDGTSGTAPVRLVSITVHAVVKQRLPQVVQ